MTKQLRDLNNSIQRFFSTAGLQYAIARGFDRRGMVFGSDVDVVTLRTDVDRWDRAMSRFADWQIMKIVRRQYVVSYFVYDLKAKLPIQVDFEFDFDWWSFQILSSNDILGTREFDPTAGIFLVAKDVSNFMRKYRSLLWGGTLSPKYKNDRPIDWMFHTLSEVPRALKKFDRRFGENAPHGQISAGSLARLRCNIVVSGIRKTGLRGSIVMFLRFLISEIQLLITPPGKSIALIVDGSSDEEIVLSELTHVVTKYRSPFKGLFDARKNTNYWARRIALRDCKLVLVCQHQAIDFVRSDDSGRLTVEIRNRLSLECKSHIEVLVVLATL